MTRIDHSGVIVADVGNSTIKLGAIASDDTLREKYVCGTPEECRSVIGWLRPRKIVYSNVRPGFEPSDFGAGPRCECIDGESIMPASYIVFPDRLDVGTDRKMACLAAATLVEQPLLVVTLGTATSASYLADNKCRFSVIWPGLGTAVRAVNQATRLNASDDFEGTAGHPSPPADMTLADSLRWGVILSTAHAIAGFVREFTTVDDIPRVVGTGGYCTVIADHIAEMVVRPWLVLEGLAGAWAQSQGRAGG